MRNDFLKILFFSKTVLLTPYPIDLAGSLEISLENPLTAITARPSIEIDVLRWVSLSEEMDIFDIREMVKEKIPPGSVYAKMMGEEEIVLSYTGYVSVGKNDVRIQLFSDEKFPTNKKFERLVIHSEIEMKSVSVYWKNFKM
jgi:hypothetical protein